MRFVCIGFAVDDFVTACISFRPTENPIEKAPPNLFPSETAGSEKPEVRGLRVDMHPYCLPCACTILWLLQIKRFLSEIRMMGIS